MPKNAPFSMSPSLKAKWLIVLQPLDKKARDEVIDATIDMAVEIELHVRKEYAEALRQEWSEALRVMMNHDVRPKPGKN